MAEQKYKISPEGIKGAWKEPLLKLVAVYLLLVIVIVILDVSQRDSGDYHASTLPIALGAATLATVAGVALGTRKQAESLRSYELTFLENSLARTQKGLPAQEILFDQISKITRTKDGVIHVWGKTPGRNIDIPLKMERAEELLSRLQSLKPIE